LNKLILVICVSGLKKVTSDMQTHKNQALRDGPAPFVPQSNNTAASPVKPVAAVKPPLMVKEGKKWIVVRMKETD
jgi:adenylyl cyclase-associated protein